MTLEEVLEVMYAGEKEGKRIVRLHTGDPCLYGAIREQMDALEERQIPYEVCPGVSSFAGQQQRCMQNIHCLIFPSLW